MCAILRCRSDLRENERHQQTAETKQVVHEPQCHRFAQILKMSIPPSRNGRDESLIALSLFSQETLVILFSFEYWLYSIGNPSIWRRLLDMIDDEDIHRVLLRLNLESELFLQRSKERGRGGISCRRRCAFRAR